MAMRFRTTMLLVSFLCLLLLSACRGEDIAVVEESHPSTETAMESLGELPEEYGYEGIETEEDFRRRLPEPTDGKTVLSTVPDPGELQTPYLWEEGNVPAVTELTPDYHGSFDPWDFRPYLTAIPVRSGVEPKGAVVLMASGAYDYRGNYADGRPARTGLRHLHRRLPAAPLSARRRRARCRPSRALRPTKRPRLRL